MSSLSRKSRSRSHSNSGASGSGTPNGAGNNETPFINEGLARWNQGRREWTAKPVNYQPPTPEAIRQREAKLDPDELYTELISPQYRPFQESVSLAYLISVLLEVWEEDGLLG